MQKAIIWGLALLALLLSSTTADEDLNPAYSDQVDDSEGVDQVYGSAHDGGKRGDDSSNEDYSSRKNRPYKVYKATQGGRGARVTKANQDRYSDEGYESEDHYEDENGSYQTAVRTGPGYAASVSRSSAHASAVAQANSAGGGSSYPYSPFSPVGGSSSAQAQANANANAAGGGGG